jgi:hypothetical protein
MTAGSHSISLRWLIGDALEAEWMLDHNSGRMTG